MFNVIRSNVVPNCLSAGKYNTQEVVQLLEPMFLGKCYLCEQDELSDPEIEHFEPHEGDSNKKFNWNNLYYSCGRCNSIKSNTHKNLIDCCDSKQDVFRRIKCTLPSIPDDPINVVGIEGDCCEKTNNTVELLLKCYNQDNTALRGITRAVLIEKLFGYYADFLTYRTVIRDKRSTDEEIKLSISRINAMLQARFPFSVFWRWHVLSDSFLMIQLEEFIDF